MCSARRPAWDGLGHSAMPPAGRTHSTAGAVQRRPGRGFQGKVMSLLRQRWRRDPRRRPDPLVRLATEPFPAGDLVLLCTFGPDLARPRTHQELSHALLQAGYDGPLPRHVIATSPVLRRHGNHYVLQRFTV